MSDVLSRVAEIAQGAAHTVSEAVPLLAQVATQAQAATTDHEGRLAKLEALIAQWAPLIAATAAAIDKAATQPEAAKPAP
jgi:hypothetical protein